MSMPPPAPLEDVPPFSWTNPPKLAEAPLPPFSFTVPPTSSALSWPARIVSVAVTAAVCFIVNGRSSETMDLNEGTSPIPSGEA